MDVGLLQHAAAELGRVLHDLFAHGQGLLILVLRVLLQAEFLVAVADVGQGAGGLQLGLDPQFLVRDRRLADPHCADVPFQAAGLSGRLAGPLAAMSLVQVDHADHIARHGPEIPIAASRLLGLFQGDRHAEDAAVHDTPLSRLELLGTCGCLRGRTISPLSRFGRGAGGEGARPLFAVATRLRGRTSSPLSRFGRGTGGEGARRLCAVARNLRLLLRRLLGLLSRRGKLSAYARTSVLRSVILSEAKDLLGCEGVQMLRFAQHDGRGRVLG